MRTKVTLVLIFLNVALFFFIFKFERNWRTETASLEARRRVLGPEAADIRSIEVTGATPETSFSLVRVRDTWALKSPLDWPANPRAAGSIVNELQLLEHEASFRVSDLARNNQTLADFGLDRPKLTVAFASGDPTAAGAPSRAPTVLRIGDATKDGKRLYVLSPEGDRIHVVNRSLADRLTIPLEQLRADALLSIRVFEARSLVVQTGATASDSARPGAGIRVRIRFDGTRWKFDAPITARAGKTAVELALNELNALRVRSFLPATAAPAPSAAPSLRVTIEGNNRQETLYLGEVVPGTGGAKGDPEYVAQLEGRSARFTVAVPAALTETLRNAQEALREKRIMEFEAVAVTAVELSAPIAPNQPPLTLQRLEPPAGQAATASPPWQIVRPGDGTTGGPQTLPADRAAVQKLLEGLALLSAEKFKSDAPTSADLEDWGFNRPVREIKITAAGSPEPVVLRIGTGTDRNLYARVGSAGDPGNAIYQIRSDILAELPLAPIAWRDRAVAEPLPPATRIAALQITDLESKQVVFQAALAADGTPTPAPRDPAAVKAIIAALRALRAKEFVPGGYSEKVGAAGEDRPWRFALEATLAVPGPAGVEQSARLALQLTERLGGSLQYAGSKELDAVFSLEQPFVDALWTVLYGPRDPGPREEPKK